MIDVDMPDNCDECRFNTEYGFCKAMPDNFCGNTDNRKRPEWCPLKEQEAVEPKQVGLYGKEDWYGLVCVCPDCKAEWMSDKADTHFCPKCGREVEWDD